MAPLPDAPENSGLVPATCLKKVLKMSEISTLFTTAYRESVSVKNSFMKKKTGEPSMDTWPEEWRWVWGHAQESMDLVNPEVGTFGWIPESDSCFPGFPLSRLPAFLLLISPPSHVLSFLLPTFPRS
jgi:hypothetical protein